MMKVAIAGYGIEGEINYAYWVNLGHEVTIFDEATTPSRPLPEGAKTQLGEGSLQSIFGYDLVVRTASLNPDKIKTDGKIWSATNEFFEKCPAPIIGVTGTKGKGTTTSLIAAILHEAGRRVHVVGNIGIPALSMLPKVKADDIVVFELSSFQLWDVQYSPETAVILMIEEEHQDIHTSMQDYVDAKTNIGRFQSPEDLLVYHPTNQYAAQAASHSRAQKKHYMTEEAAYIAGGEIRIEGHTICLVEEVGLIGPHNLENICAAISAAWRYTQDVEAIARAAKVFKGLPHRLELIREELGIKYYNDSFSTASGSTIAAINSFSEPVVLICGGYDRGLDLHELADAIVGASQIRHVVLMGQTGKRLAKCFDQSGYSRYTLMETEDFANIIKTANSLTEEGGVLLFSPGAASFDMFENFVDRSEQFKKLVGEL